MRLHIGIAGATVVLTIAAGSLGAAAQSKKAEEASEHNVIVSVVGCVQLEADYRKQISNGNGGPLGSGAGVANEVVLTSAKSVPTQGIHTEETHALAATADLEEVYSITGKLEDQLKRETGRQVEVTGYVKVDESAGTAKVKDLPRMDISRWTRVADFCPSPGAKQ